MCTQIVLITMVMVMFVVHGSQKNDVMKPPMPLRVLRQYNDPGTHPYVVSIIYIIDQMRIFNFTMMKGCSGTLISNQWTLTAAHCMDPHICTKRKYRIIYNNFTLLPQDHQYYKNVLRCIPHPSYRDHQPFGARTVHNNRYMENPIRYFHIYTKNDIGLMKNEKIEMKFGKLSGIDYLSLIGRQVQYYGFGVVKPSLTSYQDAFEYLTTPLQYGEALVVKCGAADLKGKHAFICLRSKCALKDQSVMFGDSGGPLLYNNKIVGVCSGSTTYTAVSQHLSWLASTISSGKY